MTVEFTDVYDGREHIRVEQVNVEAPGADDDDLDDWAHDNIRPHAGAGFDDTGGSEAGYFANIKSCAERPDLVGREFEWGV
jgi:hypothetical protein